MCSNMMARTQKTDTVLMELHDLVVEVLPSWSRYRFALIRTFGHSTRVHISRLTTQTHYETY